MASNMVILYNAVYIYIELVLFPVSNDSGYIFDFKSAAGCSSTADDEPQWWLMFLDGFKTHTF